MITTCHECGADQGSVGVIKTASGPALCPVCVHREGIPFTIDGTPTRASEVKTRTARIAAHLKELTDTATDAIERLSAACEGALLFLELLFLEASVPSPGTRERRDRLVIELRKALGTIKP